MIIDKNHNHQWQSQNNVLWHKLFSAKERLRHDHPVTWNRTLGEVMMGNPLFPMVVCSLRNPMLVVGKSHLESWWLGKLMLVCFFWENPCWLFSLGNVNNDVNTACRHGVGWNGSIAMSIATVPLRGASMPLSSRWTHSTCWSTFLCSKAPKHRKNARSV